MPDEVFGMSREGARRTAEVNRRVLGQRVETGRRTRRVYPPGGGGGVDVIRFTILTANCTTKCATATINNRRCGLTSDIGDTVNLHDAVGCQLTGNEAALVGRTGYAINMNGENPCKAGTESCVWEILTLCCPVESCG